MPGVRLERLRIDIAEQADVGQEQRRVVDQLLDEVGRFESGFGSHIVERAGLLQLLDRSFALQHVERGLDERIDLDRFTCAASRCGPIDGGHTQHDTTDQGADEQEPSVRPGSRSIPVLRGHGDKLPCPGGRASSAALRTRQCRDRHSIPALFGLLGLNASRPLVTSGV